MREATYEIAVFDVDGTLVDSNYQHVIAWHRAFQACDVAVPLWQIHRHLGMGGDKLVAAVAGEEREKAFGDEVRNGWKKHFSDLIDEVRPVAGSHELLRDVRARGLKVVLASSGDSAHVQHFVDLLRAEDLADAWTTSGDVEETKPEPELLEVAVAKVGGGSAITFGDSTWDCLAAGRFDAPAIAIRTGGFGVDELQAAGALRVFDSLTDLRSALPDVLRTVR